MTGKIVVLCTCGTEQEASRIARALVESRLAACVNIVPSVRSIYRWNDAVEEGSELLLLIKTSRELYSQVQAAIESLHSYELPEAIALEIVDGSERYLSWLADGLKADPGTAR